MKILGIELRRTAAVVVAVLTALVVLLMLNWGPSTKNSTAWTRQWSSMVEWSRFMLVFAVPLVLGAGALQGMRDRRSGVDELFATTPRPRAQRVGRTLGAFAVALGAAYLLVLVVGATRVVRATDHFHWAWLPVALVGVLALVGSAWLGLGVGRVLPSALTPPVLAGVGLALMVFGQGPVGETFRLTLLRPAVPMPESVFERTAPLVSAGQAVWFTGVAVTGALLFALRRWWLGLLPLVVAGAVAVPLLPGSPAEAVVADRRAAEVVCEGQLCLTRAHENERAALEPPVREALRLLAALPSPPTAVREVVGTAGRLDRRGPEPTDVVPVDLDEFTYFRSVTPVTPEQVTRFLVAGAGTRTCYGERVPDEVSREVAARTVLTSWLTGELEPLPLYRQWLGEEIDALSRTAWDALRALPEADQAARVQATREVLAACSGDALRTLTGGTS
ncbi:hypothetical protein [Saccharothrix sp. Mg75]|uniref:hypothetical protein n=1 Tax=Saccharothrix sp. Mg75 TaxID=3445357 RepID=UPI003EEF2911